MINLFGFEHLTYRPALITVLIVALGLLPHWFFLLPAYHLCNNHALAKAPVLWRVGLWPGYGLAWLMGQVPPPAAHIKSPRLKPWQVFTMGSGITVLFWGVALFLYLA
jgi:hypothetical protein